MVHLRPHSTKSSVYFFHLPINIGKPGFVLPFVLLFTNFFRIPLIILITTTGAARTVSAVSLAGISVPTLQTDYEIDSANYNTLPQPLVYVPNSELIEELPTTYELEFARRENGEKISLTLDLSEKVEQLSFYDRQNKDGKHAADPIKKIELLKKTGGDTRISSNQDVTTLALAIDNSSSVAIANINSSYNNVFVSIANPSHLHAPPYPYNETIV